jgi:hypothetical protein
MDFHGFSWICIGFHVFLWVFIDFHRLLQRQEFLGKMSAPKNSCLWSSLWKSIKTHKNT